MDKKGLPEFSMPMFRSGVPQKVRPWIYAVFILCFQLSGGVYLGSSAQMFGSLSLMREDIVMCLYVSLAGMAIYFPILFRMKFRFTNQSLLVAASLTMALANFLVTRVESLPLLWAICFLAGAAKIQGTFECMSNIQLWITRSRDMRTFFPALHIFLLCGMQLSDLVTVHVAYHTNWHMMHYLIIGIMLTVCFLVLVLTRNVRLIPKVPLSGIDWTGAVLWLLFSLQLLYIFNYGEWHDWYHSPEIRVMTGTTLITFGAAIHRMLYTYHAYYDRRLWTFKYMKQILVLIMLTELFFATENALESVFLRVGMHYDVLNDASLDWAVLAGALTGSGVTFLCMRVVGIHYYRMLSIGMIGQTLYLATMYFMMDTSLSIEMLYLPCFLRGFAYVALSATYFICLFDAMNFTTFFQSVSLFNMIHMSLGGAVGGALYGFGLRYLVRDNIARYSGYIDNVQQSLAAGQTGEWISGFMENMQLISLKQLYGYVLWASIIVTIAYLAYDRPEVRRGVKKLPYWRDLAETVGQSVLLRKWSKEKHIERHSR